MSAELSSLGSLDVRRGIARIDGKENAYRKQLLRLREHYAGAAEELRGHLKQDDLCPVKDYRHSLKGVSGIIGALADEIAAIESRVNAFGIQAAVALIERLQAQIHYMT